MHQSQHQHLRSNKQNIDNASINDMIALLKQYQKMCLDKQDFSSADQAKTKIQFLKSQQIILKRQKMESEDKQNMEIISKQGEQQIRMFQEYWDQHLQQLIENLKLLQRNLEEQHERQLAEFLEKLQQQEPPKMKYSAMVLDLRKHLRNLIKVKNYKQAEVVKIKLETKQRQQDEKWAQKIYSKKQAKLQALKKKQQTQLNALRVKAETSFNQSIKDRDQKFQILLKKNRKRRIQSGKISRERLKTKTALLNESKSYLAINKH